ncbi:MAG: hypothetical protein HC873_03000 [Leptolyngbyaceae cyanobacterium SL_1_1]|nr:hypothetical protein [Leptolyngbyaceae cyanobacterium SL_1_1]
MVARVDRAKAFFQDKITAEEFLAECDVWMIELVQTVLVEAIKAGKDERNLLGQ